jgi:hypothetical protein
MRLLLMPDIYELPTTMFSVIRFRVPVRRVLNATTTMNVPIFAPVGSMLYPCVLRILQ